jgi:serine/threonine-protein kinase
VAKVLDFGLARSEDYAGSAPIAPPQELGARPTYTGDDEHTLSISPTPTDETNAMSGSDSDNPDLFLTRFGELIGTPVYMSPEQARGEPATTASDMYSYGLLLQKIFSGARPHPKGLSSLQILVRAGEGRTTPVKGIDSDLAALVNRLKSFAPAARPNAVAALERLRWIRAKPKRRIRRLVAAAVIAAVAVSAAKYTFDLKVARDDANLRREQAEDLIGFMIGDLRSKLAPVSRLEVLDDIGDEALEYFAAIPAVDLSPDELLFRSRTLSQIGQVRMDQGDLPAALEAFKEAKRLAAGLVERDPDNGAWRAELGAAHFWAGSVFWMQRDLDGALDSFRQYLDESRELVEREPENLDWQLELSYAYSNIGSVREAQGDVPGAIDALQESLEINQRLVAAQPDNAEWRSELAGGHSWLGRALLSQGDLTQSSIHYLANRDLLEELVREDPDNRRYRWLLGIAHGKVAIAYELQGMPDEARPAYDAYLAINLELVREDPENSTWQRELAVARRFRGELAHTDRDSERAVAELDAARTILRRLIDLDPTNTDWTRQLAWTQARTALVLSGQSLFDEALQRSEESLTLCDALLSENPDDPELKRLWSEIHLTIGDVAAARGRKESARGSWVRALDVIEPLARGTKHPLDREVWAVTLLRLDRIKDARELVDELRMQGLRRAEFERLSRNKGVWPE